ncbi:MAG TPA: lysozyme [Flavobacterium sp.]|nr:lysozyme [Flavobacterium sp.]
MKLNNEGYKLICDFEGLSLKPYLCSAKVPTIGYGNTYYPNGKRVTLLDDSITKEYAFEIYKDVADRFAQKVNTMVKVPITQNQFNSLVSFNYNTGALSTSTLLKKVNANPNDKTIENEFLKWVKAGGKVVKGLIIRREKEAEIYFKQ